MHVIRFVALLFIEFPNFQRLADFIVRETLIRPCSDFVSSGSGRLTCGIVVKAECVSPESARCSAI